MLQRYTQFGEGTTLRREQENVCLEINLKHRKAPVSGRVHAGRCPKELARGMLLPGQVFSTDRPNYLPSHFNSSHLQRFNPHLSDLSHDTGSCPTLLAAPTGSQNLAVA